MFKYDQFPKQWSQFNFIVPNSGRISLVLAGVANFQVTVSLFNTQTYHITVSLPQ